MTETQFYVLVGFLILGFGTLCSLLYDARDSLRNIEQSLSRIEKHTDVLAEDAIDRVIDSRVAEVEAEAHLERRLDDQQDEGRQA